MECRGRVALVTGASGGIGAAIAMALHRAGARVALAYHRHEDRARAVQQGILADQGQARLFQADLTNPDAARRLVEEVEAAYGGLDILVNNAGMALERLVIDTTVHEWDLLMAVHLRAAFVCSKAALPGMIHRSHGRIINIASMWGQVGAAMEVAYSAAKAGLIGFTKALAKEVGSAGITVNAVAPGAIHTDMLADYSPEALQELRESTPVLRLGTPEDVAWAVRFLASDKSGFITGQVLAPNGGYIV